MVIVLLQVERVTQLTLDAEGDINLDSNSGVIAFKDNATSILNIANSTGDVDYYS